ERQTYRSLATAVSAELPVWLPPFAAGRRVGVRVLIGRLEEDERRDALLTPVAAVRTGVVVIVVAIAVVLVVLFVTVSMRGRRRRGLKRSDQTRRDPAGADERAARGQRDRNIAHEHASQRS